MFTRGGGSVVIMVVLMAACSVAAVAGQNTNFSFPLGFLDPGNMPVFAGDAAQLSNAFHMNPVAARQKTMNSSCGRVVWKDSVRMVNNATGTVASFSTAFTFSFSSDVNATQCGDGMVFAFYNRNWTQGIPEGKRSGGTFCFLNSTDFHGAERVFAVEIDSFFIHHNPDDDVLFEDYSDSHIAVDLGARNATKCSNSSMIYNCKNQYNLCNGGHYFGGNSTSCSFFCGVGEARKHTAWIDYNSTTQLLKVWFRNDSSLSNGITRPAEAIITVPNLRLGEILEDQVYVGFTASTGAVHETHVIHAWEFESTGMPDPPEPKSPAPEGLVTISNPESRRSPVAMIAGVSCAALVAAVVVGLALYMSFFKLRARQASEDSPELVSSLEATETSRMYKYRELSRATKNFSASELLSSGAFGDVYRGILQSGTLVAIKRMKEDKEHHGQESFLAEATSLRQIRHRNLLQLRGWSHSPQLGLFLVYDYMSNGSLDKWIYRNHVNPDVGNRKLSWDLRQSILAGVAAGLEYLHEGWVQCVLHRDIKSSNVLLDADFSPCLGDFGLARLVDHNKLQRTTLLAGTLGYMAPEMMHTGRATKETDVYAFGIVVLEVVCGRRPLDIDAATTNAADYVLLDSVWRAHEAGDISSVAERDTWLEIGDDETGLVDADTLVMQQLEMNQVANLLHLGLLCCLPAPNERPSMRAVNRWFQSGKEGTMDQLPPLPTAKPHYNPVSSSGPLSLDGSGVTTSTLWSQSSDCSYQRSTPSNNGSFAT